jgi:hypothetical protein
VVVAELVPSGSLQTAFVDLGLAALATAALLMLVRDQATSRLRTDDLSEGRSVSSPVTWRWTLLGLGAGGALIAQTWFKAGTTIAFGDIAPPIGTAWIGRVFEPFGWSGTNLGGPATNQGQLPWAVISEVTHLAGGSGALAQRLWLTLLISAIFVAGAALARSLGLGPVSAVVVGALYFFNPMTLSEVWVNDVYLLTMVLLAALPAVVISYGRGGLSLTRVCLCFAVAAPFVGYAYANPPLVGMLALVVAATPLLVWIRYGKDAARRSVGGLTIGGALLIGVSAYWLIPARNAVSGVAAGNLSSLSSWAFTESRYTLVNGLWLNTEWGWKYTLYYSYAPDFGRFPLELVRALVPLVAFAGLAIARTARGLERRWSRLTAALTLGVLAVIVLGTGTRSPGDVVFDHLYRLPYGWLLREPGRFLMVAALGCALLAGLLVERLRALAGPAVTTAGLLGQRIRGLPVPAATSQRWGRWSIGFALAAVAVALAAAFPLWTGTLVAGPRQGYPSVHVKVPADWVATAHYLNSGSAPSGSLLVLPPDDFYQMPYTWYYGNEQFIPDLLDRHVVVPYPQGYSTVSAELLSSVKLEASALLDRSWREAGLVLNALGTPVVLVRGDIESPFADRDIVSPVALAASLTADPEMQLVHRDGTLSLYQLRDPYRHTSTDFATVDTGQPDLRTLAVLPPGTALVTSKPRPGHLNVVQLPPLTGWHATPAALTTRATLPSGWTYSVPSTGLEGQPAPSAYVTRTAQGESVQIQVPLGGSVISNGSFSAGLWGPTGNCYALPVHPHEVLGAVVERHGGPGGTRALQLSASADSACQATPLSWFGGDIYLQFRARSVEGAPPSFCVWEEPIGHCAPAASLPSTPGWHQYTEVVQPDAGTTRLFLFLYANSFSSGRPSVEQYTDVVARLLRSAPTAVVVGRPTGPTSSTKLVATATGYSTLWSGPTGTTHVLVNGLRNGWLTRSAPDSAIDARYTPDAHLLGDELALLVIMVLVALACWGWSSGRLPARRRRRTGRHARRG